MEYCSVGYITPTHVLNQYSSNPGLGVALVIEIFCGFSLWSICSVY
jgi:hypothetical protein